MKHFVGLVAVLVLLCLESDAGPQPKLIQTPCDKSRKVHTEPWGIITDGPVGSNYTQDSHCEWLIKANSSEQYITLKFLSMGTECSFDYVYVYDGDSFKSLMLGSFSGNTEPQQVTATSGFMLILLNSNTTYVLDGFRAEYSITNCSGNCSGHGVCIEHSCNCKTGWGGRDCGLELCPEKCGVSMGRGHCVHGQCHCQPGYSGQACTLYIGDPVGNRWHWISKGLLSPRAAHTAIYINETDALYVFGGFDLNFVLGDLHVFKFNLSQWEDEDGKVIRINSSSEILDSRALQAVFAKVGGGDEKQGGLRSKTFFQNVLFTIADNNTFSIKYHGDNNYTMHRTRVHRMTNSEEDDPPLSPEPRYLHAACNYPGGFIMYGGKMEDVSLSSELWLYEVTGGRWSLRALSSKVQPPPLARHTITLTNDGWIYLVGGATEQGQFSSKIFKIKLKTVGGMEEWSEVIPMGGQELDVRIVGHSTVYNSQSGSLLVYGGLLTSISEFAKLSDRMFSFHLNSHHWAEIHYPRAELLRDTYIPRERAFHTSTIIGNYLVVFGGYAHRHNKEEVCSDKQMYLYHMGCHTWVSHDILGIQDKAYHQYPKKQGVFAHSAALRNGNTLLLVGGYHGNMNADLLAYTLPSTIASRDGEPYDPEASCSRHHNIMPECTGNPECGWCSADMLCYGRTLGINCTTNLQTARCPGICPGLGDFHSCLLHGDPPGQPPATAAHSVAYKLHLGECTWCVQNGRCHHKDGILAVNYKQGEQFEGFNTTLTVLSCPDKCPINSVCRQGQCVCLEGSTGPDCNDFLSPNNCSADLKQGISDKVCGQGCVRGTCMGPNDCHCDFGYVGANCSIQCQCNGHSECSGPDKLDTCLACYNNTQGPQCQRCKPLFVGDPTDSGKCVPCIEYCNGHTHLCINDSITEFRFIPASPLTEVIDFLGEGPTTRARCVWCGNRTTGDKCEDCLEGNFRGTEDHRSACRPCECHGHGDTCDPVTGEKCNCANNTESDAACQSTTATKNNHHCWMLQCSKCKKAYSGTPTGGHQCYKQMNVDYKFCLDAKLIEECKMKPKPLNPFQTVFFMVQPRFMNMDIQLTVDVTQGGLDLFLSPRDDTFVVDVNISSGDHSIKMDRKYISHGNDDSYQLEFENGTTPLYHSGQEFTVVEQVATGLTTFITLNQQNTLLFVRNLTDSLVLTLPQDKHNLGSTRFYIALIAVGQPAYGTVFFTQDRPHIDFIELFIIFSVLFWCLFSFLGACVVAWKAKQAAHVRSART